MNIKRSIKFLVVGSIIVFTGLLAQSVATHADSTLVTDPDNIVPESADNGRDIFAEIATIRNGNYLEAPTSYIRLSFNSRTGNVMRIGFCNSNSNVRCGGSGFRTDEWNNVRLHIRQLNQENETTGAFLAIDRPQPNQDISLPSVPNDSHRSPVNGKFNYLIAVHFINKNDAAFPPVIPFRVRAAGGTSPRAGFAKNLSRDMPLAVQNRNRAVSVSNTSHTDTIRVRMRVPCAFVGSEASRVTIKWLDADGRPPNSNPKNYSPVRPQIDWEVDLMRRNTDTGSPNFGELELKKRVTASQFAFQENTNLQNYIGGQDEDKDQVIQRTGGGLDLPYQPGDIIEWRWKNVLANNGVQVQIPFDDASLFDTCTPPPNDANDSACTKFNGASVGLPNIPSGSDENILLASFGGSIISNNKVAPGQNVLLGVAFENSGTSTWNGGFGTYALANDGWPTLQIGSAPSPYNQWNVNNTSNPKLVYYPGGNGTTPPDGKAQFWFRVTIPDDIGETMTFSWRMRQTVTYQNRPATTFGDRCSITVKVAQNRPYLRVSGGDVRSGARFDNIVNPAQPDSKCSYDDDAALNANINTNGFYESSSGEPDGDSLNGSSSGQYAVFATGLLGNIQGTNNFSANNLYTRDGRKDLVFANTGLNDDNYGEYYSRNSAYCVEVADEIAAAIASEAENPTTVSLTRTVSNDNGYAYYDTGDLVIDDPSDFSVQGQKIVVVKGNVTIKKDIPYDPNYESVSNIPNLTLIVLGNIYVERAVGRLDGTYIALPTNPSDLDSRTGIINTCSDRGGSVTEWPNGSAGNSLITSSCGKLTVNGRLIAKDILLKRTHGTLGDDDSAASAVCAYAQGNGTGLDIADLRDCAAELIEFSPEAYFNNPSDEPTGTTSVSNVPNSTIELPPIY